MLHTTTTATLKNIFEPQHFLLSIRYFKILKNSLRLVAIVLVTDKDNRGEEVTASIDNSAFELVKFEVGSFQLILAEALDYEQTTVIQATISATDGEQSPLTKVYPLEIVVQDVNDNGPKFQLEGNGHFFLFS